jgi:hypothetical protein
MGACNQGEKCQKYNYVSSLVDTRSALPSRPHRYARVKQAYPVATELVRDTLKPKKKPTEVSLLSCCHVVKNTLISFLDLCLQSLSLILHHQILQR